MPLLAGRVTDNFTPRAKRALHLAEEEAMHLGHASLGTQHLLLALLHESSGAALAVLRGLGVDSGAIDAEVRVVISLAPGTYVIKGPKDNVVTCRVDDVALNAIDALVEAGIRSTRSDAAAWLISSGIEANHDFFVQVYSTVAEIRRLREKAQALARSGPATPPAAGRERGGRRRTVPVG